MSFKNSVIASLMVVGSLATRASACMYQVDQVKQKNDLIAQVLSAAKLDLTKDMKRISLIAVEDFKYWESISTPMCPDELSYQGKVIIRFMAEDKITVCMIRSVVTKIENFADDRSSSAVSFEFEHGTPASICPKSPAVAAADSGLGSI